MALGNLCLLALLGVTLRSKILFPMQLIDFTYILHAHSNFAFAGWITLALAALMIYDILPADAHNKKTYMWLLWTIEVNALAIVIAFVIQGYAFFSIFFSTVFVVVTYLFSYLFARDLLRSEAEKAVKILCLSALTCLVLSSVGPLILAYLVAAHSVNNLLYRDSVYTYLHLQYNGFFALAVFALFINGIYKTLNGDQLKKAGRFAATVSLSIFPTLFISYLLHYPDTWIMVLSIIGCVFILLSIYYLITFLGSIKNDLKTIPRFTRNMSLLALIAFQLKSLLQMGTIIPSLGRMVYGDRAIIIGFLHLVLLGFISLYLLSHFLNSGALNVYSKFTKTAIVIFTSAVVANEVILMVQGFGNLLMLSNSIYTWLLWGVSIWLFTGALSIFASRLVTRVRQNN